MPHKLTLVIHALNTGGAERVFARLANHWAQCGHQIVLITVDDVATDRLAIDRRIQRVGLGLMRPSRSKWQAVTSNLQRLRRLRHAIRQAESRLVVSFTDNINVLTLLACRGGPWQVVIAERNDPRRQRMGRGWERLRRWLYPRCAAAVVQTEAVAQHIAQVVCGRPVHVIPNAVAVPPATKPEGSSSLLKTGTGSAAKVRESEEIVARKVPVSLFQQAASVEDPGHRIVAMGRLSLQKGFDLLIAAFARVASAHPTWTLDIWGDGDQRLALETQIAQAGLSDRVKLRGWADDTQRVFASADLFVLSSRYEGFPNALMEAMACGLPAISFDCDSGPQEIIRPEVDGLLVPAEDTVSMAEALQRMLTDDSFRNRLATRAIEVTQRFDEATFFARWDDVISEVARAG